MTKIKDCYYSEIVGMKKSDVFYDQPTSTDNTPKIEEKIILRNFFKRHYGCKQVVDLNSSSLRVLGPLFYLPHMRRTIGCGLITQVVLDIFQVANVSTLFIFALRCTTKFMYKN